MSTKLSTVCDFCGVEKKLTNNWWKLGFEDDHVSLVIGHSDRHWDNSVKDACGEKCVGVAVSRFLDHGTLEEK